MYLQTGKVLQQNTCQNYTNGKRLVSNSIKYPTLVQLAKQYLAIPASSVPSERAFSAAGHIANERRSCLLPDSITMLVLVFLAENLH